MALSFTTTDIFTCLASPWKSLFTTRKNALSPTRVVMTADEVKSHSSIDRFLVVFHSPTGMAETGVLACRPEKAGRASRCNANTKDFLWSGLTMETSELAGISRDFRGITRGISLYFRLCGGEIGIRTLVTLLSR